MTTEEREFRICKVSPEDPRMNYVCVGCGATITDMPYADLNGAAFRDYYCHECATRILEDLES